MALTIIPDVVRDQEIHSLGEASTAHDAARMMAEHDVELPDLIGVFANE